jgi:hypothetical protein
LAGRGMEGGLRDDVVYLEEFELDYVTWGGDV